MKKTTATFFQTIIVLIGLGVLALMLWMPQLEGRNVNATLFEIYFKDPFLAYVYASSIAFFVGLYQTFKVLGFAGENKMASDASVKSLRTIKNCAVIQTILIVLAAAYVRMFHATEDDPAGFIALCIVATFISLVVAAIANRFQKKFQSGLQAR